MLLKQSGVAVAVRVKSHLKSNRAKSFQTAMKKGLVVVWFVWILGCFSPRVDTWNIIHLA